MAAIYSGHIYCGECADNIADKLRSAGKEPADLNDRDSYHSSKWPKYYADETESSRPEHCAGCSKFLENELSSDGTFTVHRAIARDVRIGDMNSVAITVWAPFYNFTVPTPNTGLLQDMQCPRCFSYGDFIISAVCCVAVSDKGIDSPSGCDWNDESDCKCSLCGFRHLVKEFKE